MSADRVDEPMRCDAPSPTGPVGDEEPSASPACPACGGRLIEIRAKFQCTACHRICETCCEGGRG